MAQAITNRGTHKVVPHLQTTILSNQKSIYYLSLHSKNLPIMNQDICWKQRFANYQSALAQLTKFIDKGELNELEEQGLIQAFEFTIT